MKYVHMYNELKRNHSLEPDRFRPAEGLVARNFGFHSRIRFPLQESNALEDNAIPAAVSPNSEMAGLAELVNKPDDAIEENLHFRYTVMLPEGIEKAENLIILFHGFNEKYWYKYLPWAAHMVRKTGHAVLLFPIAFHMNRAPALWSSFRPMNKVSKDRKARFPAVVGSSLSNVAISTRLHNRPERYIWSGLESYHDVIDIVEDIRKGTHPAIDAEAGIGFCSYSIGTFLGEILMMTNKNGYFSGSKYATFCGGPVFNRLSPVSKYILDSEANVRLYSYLVEHLESHIQADASLHRLLSGEYEEGVNFRSLLSYRDNRQYREEKFRELSGRFYAIGLENDEVVPPYEILNTFKGSKQDIPIRVDILDYPFPCRHEDPFPVAEKLADDVDACFRKTFDRISEFLMTAN